MTVEELLSRFPEIPPDLGTEPVVAELCETFGPLIRIAKKPSPCVSDRNAEHAFYLAFIGDMAIYGMRLAKREKVVERLHNLLAKYKEHPATFACSLVPGTPRPGAGGCGERLAVCR